MQTCCWICCLRIIARFPYWHKALVLENFIKKWLIWTPRSKSVEWFYHVFYNVVPEFKQQKIKSPYAKFIKYASKRNLLLHSLSHVWAILIVLKCSLYRVGIHFSETSTICLGFLRYSLSPLHKKPFKYLKMGSMLLFYRFLFLIKLLFLQLLLGLYGFQTSSLMSRFWT